MVKTRYTGKHLSAPDSMLGALGVYSSSHAIAIIDQHADQAAGVNRRGGKTINHRLSEPGSSHSNHTIYPLKMMPSKKYNKREPIVD